MQIAVNSVINWSFVYYICCFSIFPSNFIDSKTGVTIRNQLRIRRLDTWRHRARDHSTRHRPLPTYWWSFGTKPLSPAVFEILASECIKVTTLTFHGHVTSSVTLPFDSQVAISYRHSIVTKCLSAALSEILGPKHIGVTTMTFQGHVTSSVTSPLDSGWVISYWWSFEPKSLSLTVSKHHVLTDTNCHCACACACTC